MRRGSEIRWTGLAKSGGGPAAVVVGLGTTGLGVVRSLNRGEPSRFRPAVIGVDSNLSQPSARTRLCSKYPCADTGSDALVDTLLEISASQSVKPVLFLSKDIAVLAASRHRERLASAYDFLLPSPAVTELLMDKTRFAEYASANGFCVPATEALATPADVERAGATLRFPCVLKPCYRDKIWDASGEPKGFLLETPQALIDTYSRIRTIQPKCVVQEWVAGEDSDLYFCLVLFDERARCVRSFTGRKLRQWPCGTGNTSIAEPVSAPEVERETVRLFEHLRFSGLGSVEFKHDKRDGTYRIMEATVGRVDLQSELASANGVNLVWLAYCHLAGIPTPAACTQRRAVRWINEYPDLRSSWTRWATGTQSFAELLRSYKGPKHFATLSWRDPLPFVAATSQLLSAAIRRTAQARLFGRSAASATLAPARSQRGEAL